MSKALILGCNGQDGSYLAEYLISRGYDVHGLVRKSSQDRLANLDHIRDRMTLHFGDLQDTLALGRLIAQLQPDEIYNEADQDHVGTSFEVPGYSYDVTGAAVGKLCEILRHAAPRTRLFQPVSSNIFGSAPGPHDEEARIAPNSPYGCAKAFALHLCHMYRKVYHMHVSVAIMFNHESERRSEHYVTRKITKAASRIAHGRQSELVLGDASARVDWGHSREYMEAVWRLVQLPEPQTVVLGTGVTHSVQEFADLAFSLAGLDARRLVKTSADLARPAATAELCAKSDKARDLIGFAPKVDFQALVSLMTRFDLEREARGA